MRLTNDFDKILGFAARSGNLSFGFTAAESDLKKHRIYLLLMDCNVSDNTAEKLVNLSREVPVLKMSPEGRLGRVTGKQNNMICGIRDKGFAERLKQLADNDAEITEVRH